MERIQHFSHKHPLKFYPSEFFQEDDDPEFYIYCSTCNRKIDPSGGGYGCRKCYYFIDKSCADLERYLKHHPFHPHHTLILPEKFVGFFSNYNCNACGFYISVGYRCFECGFCLHLDCASLSPVSENRGEMHLIDQPHLLFLCDKPAGYSRWCSCCKLPFSETDSKIYVCIECKHVLHESCASLKEIRHPFHIEHPLIVLPPPPDVRNIKCNACSLERDKKAPYMFQCKQCDFALDFWCACLVPTSKRSIGFHQELQKQHLNHKHPLIECNSIKEFQHKCSCCNHSIQDSIFVCLDCAILFDRRCADLPLEVKHPCHTQHPFQLTQTESKHHYECWLCRANFYSLFAYSCACNFYLEPSCATTKPSIINCVFHEHPLAYFSGKFNENAPLRCNECTKFCREEFLHCGECKYSSHLHCYPNLPPIVKHSCHCDPLTLTYSKIKDASDEEEDEEFYCNACEELRDLRHPTYYCEECHFVAHLQCVLHEILLYMETGFTRQSLGNVELEPSLNHVQLEAAVENSSSTVDKLEKPDNFDVEDEAKEKSCCGERDMLEA